MLSITQRMTISKKEMINCVFIYIYIYIQAYNNFFKIQNNYIIIIYNNIIINTKNYILRKIFYSTI